MRTVVAGERARRLSALVLLLAVGCTGPGSGGRDPSSESAASVGTASDDGSAVEETAGSAEARGAVRIAPGEDWQAHVDAAPPGSTFLVGAGEHRGAQVTPRDGDRFIGEDGAVLNGSVLVEDWIEEDGGWVAEGFAPVGEPTGQLLDGWVQEGYPQELFLDGERLLHVDSADGVAIATWFYDAEAERLLLGQDPAGRTLELSTTPWAFLGQGVADVWIANLEIKHYASPSQSAAIDGIESIDWSISDVVVHSNHAGGIRFDRGMHITDSVIRDNGQIGVNGSEADDPTRPVLIVGNEVSGNGMLHYVWFWESGGIKLTYADQAVVHDNVVEDNRGAGIWYDLDCFGGVITDNEVHRNSSVGIFFEISETGTISRNTVTGNGYGIDPLFASGIWLSNSGKATVTDNVLAGNTNEIIIVAAPREEFGFPVADNLIAGNDITISGDGFVGLSIVTEDTSTLDPSVNRFRSNRYTLDECEPCFFWQEKVDTATWLELGNDADSTFDETPS